MEHYGLRCFLAETHGTKLILGGYLVDSLALEGGHNVQTDSKFEELGILRIF